MRNLKKLFTNNALFIFIAFATVIAASSCDDEGLEPVDQGGNNTSSITNNSITDGDSLGYLEKYAITFSESEVNTNESSYEISAFSGQYLGLANHYIRIFLKELPTSSQTFTWQTNGNSSGALATNEFFVQLKLGGKTWYGVYTSDGWDAEGTLKATFSGDKIIYEFSDIELSDHYISVNVEETKVLSGKITINKNASVSSGSDYFEYELLD